MPAGYYQLPPTPSTKNTINSVTLGTFTGYPLRDFLMYRNLGTNTGGFYPQISTAINGSPRVGEPVLTTSINNNTNVTPFGLPLEVEGILHMQISVLPNQFKNMASTANDLIDIQYVLPTQNPWPNSSFPNGTQQYPASSSQDIFKYGIMGKTQEANYRKITFKNLYLDSDSQIDMGDFIVATSPVTQQIKGYLDEYGGLNLGDSSGIQNYNLIGSVLNGQGLGLAKGGVIPNFDVRSSIAGRVLGATGEINDTKLGMIAGQQLVLALANNAAFNLQQSLLGSLNVQDNVLSLIKGGGLTGFRPNYQITVASSTLGKVADYTSRILGFTLPKSYLDDSGSIFLSESDSDNINRANAMILHTGSGQVTALIANMNANLIGTTQFDNPTNTRFRSGYAPGFKDNKGDKAINPNIYAFGDSDGIIYNFITTGQGAIPEINFNRSSMIESYGFIDNSASGLMGDSYTESNIKNPTFSWGSKNGGTVNAIGDYKFVPHDKKTLLGKTQQLFDSLGMKSIISSKGQMNVLPSQTQTAVVGFGISKGNAVMSKGNFDLDSGRYVGTSATTADETYCRSWTTFARYEKVSNLVRNKGLSLDVPYRNQIHGSVLDDNGFAKIAPYSTDSPDDPKKFMFSIENLAWSDNVNNLLPCEIGPGDLISGKQGRIMWFPPYNIQFTESNNVNWESNNFIGRGEPVYTYNNTERSGTLSFQVIVDHPSYVNSFRGSQGPDDHYVASFFAGCIDPSSKFADKLTVSEISSIESANITVTPAKVVTPQIPPVDISVYFPNDVAMLEGGAAIYENGLQNPSLTPIDYSTYVSGFSVGLYPGIFTSGGKSFWFDNENRGFNGVNSPILVDGIKYNGYFDPALIPAINTYIKEKCPACRVEVAGYASAQGKGVVNSKLAIARATYVIDKLKTQLFSNLTDEEKNKRFKVMPSKELTGTGCKTGAGTSVDTNECKLDRKAVIHFVFDEKLLPEALVTAEPVLKGPLRNVNTKITNRFYTECNYFDKLKEEDYFVFDKFREKIKYFHPAFHSTTPEGLNSRLTFLLQCTRQGPTLEEQGANNLAFGRAPVCILRIGDFYNTKIVMDNVSLDFEPLVWDLNPEGVGVQPMIANVNISFKFIGGSTLMGPINKLQNALSFNYFANTQVYDTRADYIAKVSDVSVNLAGKPTGLKNTVSLDGKYTLVNGQPNANKTVEVVITKEDIIALTPLEDQMASALLAENQIQEIPEVVSAMTITGLKYNPSTSWKDSDYWHLDLRFTIENGTGNWAADAEFLSTQFYSLAIYDVNWSDYYEFMIDDKVKMEQFINPANISNFFDVPIKKKNSPTSAGPTGTTGLTDKLGKETFILALKNPNHLPSVNIETLMFKLK